MNDHKPIFSCSAEKGNLSPKKNFCTNAIDKSWETSHYLHEKTTFSVADLLSRSFFLEQLQLIDLKQKRLPPQVILAKLTHDDRIKIKPVQYLVKRETALTSLNDDCHPCLAQFGNHQFPIRKDKEVEKKVVKALEFFFFVAVQPIQFPVKKPITKNAKKLFQLFFLMLIMGIRFGVKNHKTIFATELIWF